MSLLLFLMGSCLPHPGPPVFVEIDADSAEVKISISAEQESILPWMDLRYPLPRAEFDPSIQDRLVTASATLLKEKRGLDLFLDQSSVIYTVERVEQLEIFGAGNAEPALRIDLQAKTSSGLPPTQIALTWGLFSRVENPAERLLPVLIEARGDFDLLRGTEIEPTVRWSRDGAAPSPPESTSGLRPIPALRKAPKRKGSLCRPLFLWAGGGLLLLGAWVSRRRQRPRWTAFLLAFGLVLGISGFALKSIAREDRLTDPAALELFQDLHRNVYRSFDARSESEIYDRLSASVHGPLLDDLYAQVFRGLTLEDEGGALCSVDHVSYEARSLISPSLVSTGTPLLDEDGFAVECSWRVRGQVIHFGHEHERVNSYRARYGVRPIDGTWRITCFEPLEHLRSGASL